MIQYYIECMTMLQTFLPNEQEFHSLSILPIECSYRMTRIYQGHYGPLNFFIRENSLIIKDLSGYDIFKILHL